VEVAEVGHEIDWACGVRAVAGVLVSGEGESGEGWRGLRCLARLRLAAGREEISTIGRGGVKPAEVTAHHVRIALRKAIRHASYTRTSTDNLLVRCVLEDGTEGYGEGVPREYVTGETIDSAIDLL